MKYSNNVLNVLTALEVKGIGKAWIAKNYSSNLNDKLLAKRLNISISEFYHIQNIVKNKIDEISLSVDGFLAYGDENFPFCEQNSGIFAIKDIGNRNTIPIKSSEIPVFFAYKGDIDLLNRKHFNIAVIGILEPDIYIENMQRQITAEFIKQDAVIVSGLAIGCDSIAHQEALKHSAATIAILPSTIKNIIPKQNSDLANEIVLGGGLLLTEYITEAGHKEQISRFIERDRLQALFSDMVILVASYSHIDTKKDKSLDSGSKHAMQKALEYGIKRAVMYDERCFKNEKFNLNRELIANRDIEFVNKTDRNFKVITTQNVSNIALKFKEHTKILKNK